VLCVYQGAGAEDLALVIKVAALLLDLGVGKRGEGQAGDDHRAPIVIGEIEALRHLAAAHGEEHRAAFGLHLGIVVLHGLHTHRSRTIRPLLTEALRALSA
jgi:hypothetical protein